MSFGAPLVLMGLVVLPPLAGLYLREQRRRRAASMAAAGAPLLAPLAAEPPGPRRHVPYLLLGLGVAALIVAGAGPRLVVSRPAVHRHAATVTTALGGYLAGAGLVLIAVAVALALVVGGGPGWRRPADAEATP